MVPSNSFFLKKYSLLFEEKQRSEAENAKGTADLASCLNEFRKKLGGTKESQIEKFDKEFFSECNSEEAPRKSLPGDDNQKREGDKDDHAGKIQHQKWIKKVYKEIVFLTHPDKIGNFPIAAVVKKYTSLYQIAVSAYAKKNYSNILMVAAELDVEVPDEKIEEYILPAIKITSEEINKISKSAGYQWFHVKDSEKEMILSNYLRQLGYTFTEKQVRDAVIRKSERKVGTRPVKNTKKRLK